MTAIESDVASASSHHSPDSSANGARDPEAEVAPMLRRIAEFEERSVHASSDERIALAETISALREAVAARRELHRAWDAVEELKGALAERASWMPSGHFYSPIHSNGDMQRELDSAGSRTVANPPGIDMRPDHQVDLLLRIAAEYRTSNLAVQPTEGRRYWSTNEYYPFGDALVMRSFIVNERPKRIVEIGSGFSSALILDTLDELGDTTTVCTFVEPFPARLEALLRDADRTRHRLFVNVVQDVPLSIFDELEAGDVLVIDSSHVSKAGSDVNHLFFDVLPRLAPGVFVHVHDVIWPFSYPELWLAEGRAWNESYLLKAFLQFNEAFEVEFSMGYVILPHLERVKRELPRVYDAPGTAFWIRRKR